MGRSMQGREGPAGEIQDHQVVLAVRRILRQLSLLFAVLGGAVACIVAAMTVTSVVMRATLSRPIAGDVELTQFGIALAISLCLPWAQLHGANIIVDFFTQQLPDRANRRLDAVGALLLAAMCALLSWRTSVGARGGATGRGGRSTRVART